MKCMFQAEDVNVSMVDCRISIDFPFAKLVKNENPFFPSRMGLDNRWLALEVQRGEHDEQRTGGT